MAPGLATGLELALAVLCLALGWAWGAPRLPRRVRLAILAAVGAAAVLALGIAAHVPHDYHLTDLAEFGRGAAALVVELLVALIGAVVALAAVGRDRGPDWRLCATGVYLGLTGVSLDTVLGGQSSLQAPALLLAGSALALAAAGTLTDLPGWLARASGVAGGLVLVLASERVRTAGSPGGTSGGLPPALLAGILAVLLLAGGLHLLRGAGRAFGAPLAWAAAAWAGTTLVLALAGPGEWVPAPGAPATALYGLPLTLLVVAVSLALLDRPTGTPLAPAPPPVGRRVRQGPLAGSLIGGLLLLAGLLLLWHPAPDPCVTTAYADASSLTPARPAWAQAPDPAAPRGAPPVPAFNQVCTARGASLSRLLYVYVPGCKWTQVDPDYPLVQASGVVQGIDVSRGDSPWIHTSHDLEFGVAVDPASAWLVLGSGTAGPLLHVEAEEGRFPVAYRPDVGDRVTVAGRWIFDCGHDPATEIHPAAVVASEHDEWRADAAGQPREVHSVRVWMNSAPGVVHVPLAPFALRAGFPTPAAGPALTPTVQVVAGPPEAVQWQIAPGTAGGAGPQAAVHITPPALQESAYFELLLGYQEPSGPLVAPVSYTVAFDRLEVWNDLRYAARNTSGLPDILSVPQLGFRGTGRWLMQIVAHHAWRSLLEAVSVQGGRAYSLAAVPPVAMLAPGDEHLHLAVTGYADNDPADGVELASGSVEGPGVVSWDAGQLAALCCGRPQTITPTYGAWTLTYHVNRDRP